MDPDLIVNMSSLPAAEVEHEEEVDKENCTQPKMQVNDNKNTQKRLSLQHYFITHLHHFTARLTPDIQVPETLMFYK